MNSNSKTTTSAFGALALAATTFFASAPAAASAAEAHLTHLRGTIAAVDGKTDLRVLTTSGANVAVSLHRGTIIAPLGLTLRPGMNVSLSGSSDGSRFDATEIDAPYHIVAAPSVPFDYGNNFATPSFALGNAAYANGVNRGTERTYVLNDRNDDTAKGVAVK